jgi:hypothetical protein
MGGSPICVSEGLEAGKVLVGLRACEAGGDGCKSVAGGLSRILEAVDGGVEGGELLAGRAEAHQVCEEAPVVGVAGGSEDIR